MPLAVILVGIVLVLTTLRNTHKQLGTQLQADFTGSGNFIIWASALVVIGLIGYIPGMSKLSKGFMVLVFLGIFLANKGFFAQFNSAISSGSTSAPQPSPVQPSAVQQKASGSSSLSGIMPSAFGSGLTSLGQDFGGFF